MTASLALVVLQPACRTTPPLGPANLREPGWTIKEGQAVWKRQGAAPEIAGEILLASSADGRTFVQFSKNAFPLLIAQSAPGRWQAEVPTENKHYSGHGLPPARLLLLYLPRAVAGQPLPTGWSWHIGPDQTWRLENRRTGESLQGYFTS